MRIEGYALPTAPAAAPNLRPNVVSPAAAVQSDSPAPLDEGQPVSAHDRLRLLLDEKRGLAQAAFDAPQVPELGKHIDLRV